MRFVQYIFFRPESHKKTEQMFHVSSFVASSIQFAIAIRSRTSFAEAIVTFRIDDTLLRKNCQVSSSRPYLPASLQNNRTDTLADQLQGGKESGRTCTYNMYGERGIREISDRLIGKRKRSRFFINKRFAVNNT